MIWPLECSRAKQKHRIKEKTTTCSTVLCKSDLRIISNFQCKSNHLGKTTETQTCVPFQSCVQISQWYDLLTSQPLPDFQFFHCRSLTAASLVVAQRELLRCTTPTPRPEMSSKKSILSGGTCLVKHFHRWSQEGCCSAQQWGIPAEACKQHDCYLPIFLPSFAFLDHSLACFCFLAILLTAFVFITRTFIAVFALNCFCLGGYARRNRHPFQTSQRFLCTPGKRVTSVQTSSDRTVLIWRGNSQKFHEISFCCSHWWSKHGLWIFMPKAAANVNWTACVFHHVHSAWCAAQQARKCLIIVDMVVLLLTSTNWLGLR